MTSVTTTHRSTTAGRAGNRWLVAIMGTVLQLSLGSVYAWSYFQKPLVEGYGWKNTEVAWAFSLAICCLGVSAAVGGVCLPRFGPRKLAVTGSVCYGLGYVIAALALHSKMLWLLLLGYGLVGGFGLGLGYVTPVATAAKWFPDKKGLVTGMVVMGFGFGALLMSKVIAPALDVAFRQQMPMVFAGSGLILGLAGLVASLFLSNPPAGWMPPELPGISRPSQHRDMMAGRAGNGLGSPFYGRDSRDVERTSKSVLSQSSGDAPLGPQEILPRLFSRQFLIMWLVFFCNIAAGIAIIGFQSPLLQDLWKKVDASLTPAVLASFGATLIAVSSVFNGIGRLFWGGLSDRLGRLATFRIMLATQFVAFGCLMVVGNPWLFGALICYVLLCYGGGFGTMPSFVLDVFGGRLMPVIYGCILTAWSAAGVAGPQAVAWLKDHYGASASTYSFAVRAGLLTVGLAASFCLASGGGRERTGQ